MTKKNKETKTPEQYALENVDNFTYIDRNIATALQADKRLLSKQIERDGYRKLHLSDSYPYTFSAISHILTKYAIEYQSGKRTKAEMLEKFKGTRDGLEGHFVDIKLTWEEYEQSALGEYKRQYQLLHEEAKRLRFHPPVKHLPYKVDGETLLMRDTMPIRIVGTSKADLDNIREPKLDLTDRFENRITDLTIRIKRVLIENLVAGLDKELKRYIPEDIAFYAGLVDVTLHNDNIAELIKRTGYSVSTFWNAILFLRANDNGTGNTKTVNLINFWSAIAYKEVVEKADKDGNVTPYLRNSKAKSLQFFQTLCLLSQGYDNRHRNKYSASNIHFCEAELGEGNEVLITVDRNYKPKKWQIEDKIKGLLEATK